ncbi:MAG: DUF4124 domain-containing protein [Betaproteobacteria bacterium]
MTRICASICVFAAMLSMSSAHADLFKCKDASGKFAYQDRPCEAVTVGKIKADTSKADEALIAKNKTDSDAFNQRHSDRLQREIAAEEKAEQLDLKRREVLAQENQAIAQENQAIQETG